MTIDGNEVRKKTEEGIRLFQAGDIEAVIQVLTEAIGLNPDYPIAYHWRGMAFQRLGRDEEAKSDFSKERALRESQRVNPATNTAARWRRFRGAASDTRTLKEPRFALAFAITTGIILGVSIASTIGAPGLWFAAAAAWVVSFLVAFGVAFAGQDEVAAGIFAALAIGAVSLGVTCFANLDNASW